MKKIALAVYGLAAVTAIGCGAPVDSNEEESAAGSDEEALTTSVIKYVFVVAMENKSASQIYGSSHAPYINGTLIPNYAKASQWVDELPDLVSEPHYVWMEAGTNSFSDHTFTTDSAPSSSNSTGSTSHLVTQIKNATNGVTWRSYQEGMNSTTGSCPIASSGFYAPKHNPFIFFRDVSGNPPSKTNSYCSAHHRPLSDLKTDLTNNAVKAFNFVTPNLCHDMHGASGCPSTDTVKMGDDWLKSYMPALITFVNAHSGVVFIAWDETGSSGGSMPFLVVGPHVKKNYTSSLKYTHSSLLKSIEEILQVPILSKVSTATDLRDFFTSGNFP